MGGATLSCIWQLSDSNYARKRARPRTRAEPAAQSASMFYREEVSQAVWSVATKVKGRPATGRPFFKGE